MKANKKLVFTQLAVIIIAIFVYAWFFAPRRQADFPETATFTNVTLCSVGTKFLTFATSDNPTRIIRIQIQNMKHYHKQLRWLHSEDEKIDLTILPVTKEWKIVEIKIAQ